MSGVEQLRRQTQYTVDWLNSLPIQRFERHPYAALPVQIRGLCQELVDLQCRCDPAAYGGAQPDVPIVGPSALGAQLTVIVGEVTAADIGSDYAQRLRELRSSIEDDRVS